MVVRKIIFRSMHICMLLNFVVLVITGMMRFLVPFSIDITRLHMLSGFAITVLIGFHIFGRLKALKNILKPPKKVNRHWSVHLPLLGSLILCALFWSAAWYNWPGAKQTIGLSYESRHSKEIFRSASNLASETNNKGIHVFKLSTETASIEIDLSWIDQSQKSNNAVAIWAETKSGSLIETLYLSEPLRFSEVTDWQGAPIRRGQILPLWRNRYTAISGISPEGQENLNTGPTKNHKYDLENNFSESNGFVICAEINSPNDNSPSRLYSTYIESTAANSYALLDLVGTGKDAYKSGEMHYELREAKLNPLVERILVKTKWDRNTKPIVEDDN